MPVVSRFSMTPVKGTALQHPTSLALTRNGVEDNRRFHLVDARHRLFNGKQHGPLVRLTAQYDGRRRHLSLQIPGREPAPPRRRGGGGRCGGRRPSSASRWSPTSTGVTWPVIW